MIITSVGGGPWPYHKARAKSEGVDWDKFVLANISGWAFAKPDPRSCREVEKINSRWLGVRLSHLQSCSQRDPGVVCIARTKRRARPALEAILHGCMTEIICDEPLAVELNRLIELTLAEAKRILASLGDH